MQQQGTMCTFDSKNSWVILSPIEQSIKSKIEAVGTPLKDWDIRINYGIKTGCNEAFIISTEKRNEILSNCKTEEECKRTAELIRPILRGRDIKRYQFDWAGLYLIATFPSKHYDINDYQSVKHYLLSYGNGHGQELLEQTGATHIIDGKPIKSRKKTKNKWFETQDSISYWEDLLQPKIVWIELSDEPKFAISELMPLNTVFYLIGERINDIIGMLNSTIYKWYFTHCIGTTSGVGTNRWLKYTIEQVPLIKHHIGISHITEKIVNNEISEELGQLEIDKILFNILELTNDEINVIKNY